MLSTRTCRTTAVLLGQPHGWGGAQCVCETVKQDGTRHSGVARAPSFAAAHDDDGAAGTRRAHGDALCRARPARNPPPHPLLAPRRRSLRDVPRASLCAGAASRPGVGTLERALRNQIGAPLKSVARILGIPMWLRKLPPEAFGVLSADLPQSPAFSRQIAHRLPRDPKESKAWLKAVQFAAGACGEDFSVWLAGQPIFETDFDQTARSRCSPPTLGSRASRKRAPPSSLSCPGGPRSRSTPPCARPRAGSTACASCCSSGRRLTDPWLKPGTALGYTFVPLISSQAILEEARAMHNCADQYAERLVRENCRLFSIRRDRLRIATLEIGPHAREGGVLAVTQLKARHNMAVSADVWQAAYAWMSSQAGLKRLPPIATPERSWDQPAWWAILAPYRNAHGGAPGSIPSPRTWPSRASMRICPNSRAAAASRAGCLREALIKAARRLGSTCLRRGPLDDRRGFAVRRHRCVVPRCRDAWR